MAKKVTIVLEDHRSTGGDFWVKSVTNSMTPQVGSRLTIAEVDVIINYNQADVKLVAPKL
jgi:hypothetical protein